MVEITNIMFLVGRIILGLFYLNSAKDHFVNVEGMTGYAKSKGIKFPRLAVILGGILMLITSISFLLGIFPLIGIVSISLFYIVVTPTMHNYWSVSEDMKMMEKIQFMKNIALLGSTLMFAAIVDWPLTI